ncbi:MAG: hypothetical protein ACP5HG_09115 [Anaerolineae bacterium]
MMRKLKLLTLLSVAGLLFGCTLQAGAQTPASEALRRDAEAYAEAHDVPLDEAIARLRAQDPIGELQAVLQEQEPDAFAGLWIEHEPEYKVVVAVTRDERRIYRRYVAAGPLEDKVEMREAERTLAELSAAQVALHQALNEVDSRADSGIDVQANCVSLYVADPEALLTQLDAAGLSLPDPVCIEETGPYAEAPPLDTPPGVVFPRQRPPEGLAAEMTALLIGDLVEVDGCLRVAGEGDESYLVIWPYDHTVTAAEDGTLQIRNGEGVVVAEVGDSVRMGGGTSPSAEQATETEIPERCSGPYWIAGSSIEVADE